MLDLFMILRFSRTPAQRSNAARENSSYSDSLNCSQIRAVSSGVPSSFTRTSRARVSNRLGMANLIIAHARSRIF